MIVLAAWWGWQEGSRATCSSAARRRTSATGAIWPSSAPRARRLVAAPALDRMHPAIDVLDAAGLGLFSVTGASIALSYGLGVPRPRPGRDQRYRRRDHARPHRPRRPPRLARRLYAIPAILGATIVVVAQRAGGARGCPSRSLARRPASPCAWPGSATTCTFPRRVRSHTLGVTVRVEVPGSVPDALGGGAAPDAGHAAPARSTA